LLYCFDPDHARAIGLPVTYLYYGLLVLLALAIVASIQAVGIILVVAMLIGPGAAGYLVTSRFDRMVATAVGVAVASSLIGTLLSFHIDGATGPCIVLVQAGFVGLAFCVGRLRGDVGAVPRGS
ncbi:MAG: metal ABC transporter permease, partial [Pseudomonadota bacterium]